MARVRHAAVAAIVVLLCASALTVGATPGPGSASAWAWAPAWASAAAPVSAYVSPFGSGGPGLLAPVSWPVSGAVLVAEVVTGGASASDEFVEITNAAATPVDLVGLELVYASSSGTTVTRKASWTASRSLAPGSHLLVANALGIYAPLADATYSDGLAATGGALVVRAIGGAPLDTIGWGDATNAFVEGTAAPAPPAGSSIERRPGGSAGNGMDSNDNAADWRVNPAPTALNLASAPTPTPTATPAPTPTTAPTATPASTAEPTVEPTSTPTVEPTSTPTFEPTSSPTPVPTPTTEPTSTPSPEPTSMPTPEPSATAEPTATSTVEPTPTLTPEPSIAPTPEPTVAPTPTPTPEPTTAPTPTPTATPTLAPTPGPAEITILAARALPVGSDATIDGVLTTALGAFDSSRGGFVQDASGGIALYLDEPMTAPLPAGTLVRASGTVDERYAQRTLRVTAASVDVITFCPLPVPVARLTGSAGEADEGLRLEVAGRVTEAPSPMADGLGLMVDDGSGPIRVIVGANALGSLLPGRGDLVRADGPLGQRDSTGTSQAGYRLLAMGEGELAILPPAPSPTITPSATPSATADPTPTPDSSSGPGPTPTPTAGATLGPTPRPTATPSPTPAPTPRPTQAPSPTPPPTAAPTQTPAPIPTYPPIASVRGLVVGTSVKVTGVVTAEPGRVGQPALIAIGDASSGILVRLPSGAARPARGASLVVSGKLAAPYGQLEIRPVSGGISSAPVAVPMPAPVAIPARLLGETTEGRLVVVTGTLVHAPARQSGGDLAMTVLDDAGDQARVYVDGSSGISSGSLVAGRRYQLTGIVGQRATRKGALDGYRLWLRGAADVVALGAPAPTPHPPQGAGPSPSPSGSGCTPIARVVAATSGSFTIEGVVVAGATLLDASGRRIVVEDSTAAIEILVPAGTVAPAVGQRIRATGTAGRAYGAPRLRGTAVTDLGSVASPGPITLGRAPGATDEWKLVRIVGVIVDSHRLGERWRAEVSVGGARIVVIGMQGAAVPAAEIVKGRNVTVVGIVRRPYPGAADRRYTVLPRSMADVVLGPMPAAGSGSSGAGGGAAPTPGTAAAPGGSLSATATGPAAQPATPADIENLAGLEGRRAALGGLVVDLEPDGFVLDDGTGTARIVLRGEAADFIGLVEPDDAVGVSGLVDHPIDPGAPVLIVESAADLVRLGDLQAGAVSGPSGEPGADPGIGAGAAPAGAAVGASGAAGLEPGGRGGTQGSSGALGATAAGVLGLPGSTALGMGWLVLMACTSVVVAVARRRRSRRQLGARVAARIATFVARPE